MSCGAGTPHIDSTDNYNVTDVSDHVTLKYNIKVFVVISCDCKI